MRIPFQVVQALDGDRRNDDNDTLSYSTSDDGVRINLNADAGTPTEIARSSGGHASGDTITYNTFENIIGSAYDDDLVGSAAANTIEGGDGADDMDGGDGRDGATIGLNATNLSGDDYDDTLSYRSSDAGVIVNLTSLSFSGGHATGDNTETFDYDPDGTVGDDDEFEVSSFENLIGSAHGDRLTGDFRANTLNGLAGDDNLKGAAGADTLIGGPGADTLDGGKSKHEPDPATPENSDDDIEHIDVASYETSMKGVTVDLDAGRGTAGDADGDTFKNIERYMGSPDDDTFIASEDPDSVDAGGHDDDGDTISYEKSEEGVTVVLPGQTAAADPDPGAQTSEIPNPQYDPDDPNEEAELLNPGINPEGSYARMDVLRNFENVTGSNRDDDITGAADTVNILKGGGGKDMLTAVGGVVMDRNADGDTEDPGETNIGDTLMGEAGDDMLYWRNW